MWFGRSVPNTVVDGLICESSWMPIDFSCWVKMAVLVARRWLPAVVS